MIFSIVSNCDFFLSLLLFCPYTLTYYIIPQITKNYYYYSYCCCCLYYLLWPLNFVKSQPIHQRSGLDELEVLDKVSRLSIDPFQQNRRLSETTLLDLQHSPTNRKGLHHEGHHLGGHPGGHGNGGSCQSRSESHSVAQSPPFENISTASSLDSDNPFQNDQLPVWQNQHQASSSSSVRPKARRGHGHGGSSTMTPTSPSETSSPDNNYGGQGRAYCYQNLNETPLSPDWVNHRQRQQGGLSPPSSPVAQVIQVSN